jgi:hypothetical protein
MELAQVGTLEPVFIEERTCEITRMSHKPLIKNAEDATVCYDCIIPGVGNLASQCHGLHWHVAIMQGKTLAIQRKLTVLNLNRQISQFVWMCFAWDLWI